MNADKKKNDRKRNGDKKKKNEDKRRDVREKKSPGGGKIEIQERRKIEIQFRIEEEKDKKLLRQSQGRSELRTDREDGGRMKMWD